MGGKPTRTSFALWLVPEKRVFRRLAAAIRELSQEHSTPVFAPHVTLVSSIVGPERTVLEKSARLTKRLGPLVIRLAGLDGLTEYFRCLFVRVQQTDNVMRANRLARGIFQVHNQSPYMPHLSLVYGNLGGETKGKIIAAIGNRFDLAFRVRSLDVVLIRAEVSQWRRVASFALPMPSP